MDNSKIQTNLGNNFNNEVQYQNKIKRLEKQVSDDLQEINKMQENIKQLSQEKEELQNQLEMSININEQNFKMVQLNLQLKMDEIDKLQDQITKMNAKNREIQVELESTNEKLREIQFEDKLKDKHITQLEESMQKLIKNKTSQTEKVQTEKVKSDLNFVEKELLQENDGLKRKIQTYEFQSNELKKKYEEIKQNYEKLRLISIEKDIQITSFNREIQDLKQSNSILKDNLSQYQQKLRTCKNDYQNEIQNLTKELKNKRQEMDEQINEKNKEIHSLRNQNVQLEQQKQNFEKDRRQLSNRFTEEKTDRDKEIKSLQNQIESYIDQVNKLKNENLVMEQNLEQLKIDISQQKKINQNELEKNKSLQSNLKTLNDQFTKNLQEVQEEKDIFRALKYKLSNQLKEKKLGPIKIKIREGIRTPIQDFYEKKYDLENDLNKQTTDEKLKICDIIIDDEIFDKKLRQLSDLDFSKGYSIKPKGTIKCQRFLQPIAEGDLEELFLIKISNESDMLEDQLMGIKHQKSKEKYTDQREACSSAIGHMIASFLLRKFIQLLKTQSREKCYDTNYQELFLLEGNQDGNKVFYIAEKLQPGENIKRFNGYGKFVEGGDFAEFCNAFSYFTYHYTQNQLMVTYIQGNTATFYDPIVSSEDCLLSENDFGNDEITLSLVAMKNDPKYLGKKYLSRLNIKP